MVMTREQEIWAVALWVEKHHAAEGHDFIRDRIAILEAECEHEGAALWRAVRSRYTRLRLGVIPIAGQPESLPN